MRTTVAMSTKSLVRLLFVLVLSVSAIAQTASQKPVVIDGAKNPERFPEWYIWETVFEVLPRERVSKGVPLYVQLGISEPELAFLLNEARLFQQSKEVLAKQLRDTKTALEAKRRSEDEIRDATQEHDLNYRYKILDARARVYEAFSPEGISALRAWIGRRLSGTQVHLRGRALQNFWKPW